MAFMMWLVLFAITFYKAIVKTDDGEGGLIGEVAASGDLG